MKARVAILISYTADFNTWKVIRNSKKGVTH